MKKMKNLKNIFVLLMCIVAFIACDDDESQEPNISFQDFLTVSNGKATLSNDGTYYVLTEYEHPDTIAKYGLEMHVFIVDRKEDAAKIEALGNVTGVMFNGVGQVTDYRPAGTDGSKKHYMIMLTSVEPWTKE